MEGRETAGVGNDVSLRDVYGASGHLLRRCQQIAVAIFLNEFRETPITPIQFSALVAIREHPGIDQKTLVNTIASDRSTVGGVVKGLEQKKFITRITPAEDQRVKRLFILPAGDRFLRETQHKSLATHRKIIAPLTAEEQETFLRLLSKIVHTNNDYSRAPLRIGTSKDEA